jgi:hypothetical protein
MGKPVLKKLSFQLRFDAPQLPEERRVPIRGDRDQLEALCDAVTIYVQELLQQSPEKFSLSLSGTKESSQTLDEPEITDFQPSPLAAKTLKSLHPQIGGARIYLEPGSYLTHKLFLGSLANPASGPVVQLSLLQLFDLATALDEYSTDVLALPNLNDSSSSLKLPVWAPVAAIMVLAVGLTPFTWQYANNIRQKQQQTAKAPAPTEARVADASPELNFPTPQSSPTAPANLQALPPIGSTSPLSTSGLPPTNPQISPGSGLPTTPQTSPNSSLPVVPPLGSKNPLARTQTKTPTLANTPGVTASTNIPGQPVAIQPNLPQNPTASISQGRITLSRRQSLPPKQQLQEKINSSGTISAQAQPSELPPVSTSSETTQKNPFIDRLRDGNTTSASPDGNTRGSTLFDTPQVAEAREYLRKRWQPPRGLAQTLEYSMVVGVDGTVERILPLNKAAREFVNSTGMPDIGKPFVSANRYGQNVRIRVVLTPDGKVQTLPESE